MEIRTQKRENLEIVSNLSEETFILAFRRFSSHKSLPRIMISDNALTYVAASKGNSTLD